MPRDTVITKTDSLINALREKKKYLHQLNITEIITRLDALKIRLTNQDVHEEGRSSTPNHLNSSHTPSNSRIQAGIRLPKFSLGKFNGDVMKFQAFWQSFTCTIDENEELPKIQKMSYLVNALEGQAYKAIEGMDLTEGNYDEVKEMVQFLKARFGKTQQIISSHMQALLNLGHKTTMMSTREVYDNLNIHIRGLKSLGVTSKEYGSLLVPVVMTRLPSEIVIEVARKTTEDVWDIEEILEIVRKEIQAREVSTKVKMNDRRPDRTSQQQVSGTTRAFVTADKQRQIQCFFCKNAHYASNCTVVQDVTKRKELLKNTRRCFLCMKIGHMAKRCQSTIKCRDCGRRHNTAICEGEKHEEVKAKEEESTSTMASKGREGVLLQTAQAIVYGNDKTKKTKINILFDGGSQRSYITEELKKKLGLKGEAIKGSTGPTAMSSKLGWLLSGPVSYENERSFCFNVSSHVVLDVIPSSSEVVDENQEIVKSLNKFWNQEACGLTQDEIPNAAGQPKSEEQLPGMQIQFNKDDSRYEVSLSWKSQFEDKQFDNQYELSKSRLNSLHSRLRKTPELLKEYDDYFQDQIAKGIIEKVPPANRKTGNNELHYLCHHGVVRRDRETTKLRVVFDGPARMKKESPSLNDRLEIGTNYMPLLFDTLIRFRMKPIAMTADIEKAFLQIQIHESDKDKLRFLWFDDGIVEFAEMLPKTKRSLLKIAAKIFDPLGSLSIFTINLKSLFQELCINKVGWDEGLKEPFLAEYQKLISELRKLHDISLPRSRMNNANIPYESKRPILLPAKSRPFKTKFSTDLPEFRVDDGPPFENVGVDFAGPLIVENKGEMKCYVCLFTCAATRAVHLELVESLDVEAFIRAFRRFTSRRGLPHLMISDNAKTYKAAAKEIKKLKRSPRLSEYLENNQITWKFIIELAPWQGGMWERLIRSVKRCLNKVIGQANLTYYELSTLVTEVESVINARPLKYIADNTDGITYALTPSQLINGRNLQCLPSENTTEILSTYESLSKRGRYHRRLLAQFTNKWKKEYLMSLLQAFRPQGVSKEPVINVNDIVLLRNDQKKRNFWKLAKVINLFKGKDGSVRAAKVQVASTEGKKVLNRALKLLIPLEIPTNNANDQNGNSNLQESVTCQQSKPKQAQGKPDTASGRPKRSAAVVAELTRRDNLKAF
eukprot:gene21467-biopygen1183